MKADRPVPNPKLPSVEQFQWDLAYEIHYMVFASVEFKTLDRARKHLWEVGALKAVCQSAALLHARNILEFAKPERQAKWAWWIGERGPIPETSDKYEEWDDFINAKVTHLGGGRERKPDWPVPVDDERLVTMSRFVLDHLTRGTDQYESDSYIDLVRRIAATGVSYLDDPSPDTLRAVAVFLPQET